MSFAVSLKRALGWNLGRVVPSPAESAALTAAGIVDPVAQRYAAWRRSLLLVAFVPTLTAAVLAVLDSIDGGFEDHTALGLALDFAWLAAALSLPAACLVGARRWTRPGAGSRLLLAAWAIAFLVPFAKALLPVEWVFHVHEDATASGAAVSAVEARLEALRDMALEFVVSSGTYMLLLPTVLSLIPGALNGCLRIKSLLPAAQLPGWLLVCASPAFLLLWLVVLLVVNEAAQSPLLVLGVLLWAGSPIVYGLAGRVFVRSQITEPDAARIARVKRIAGLVALSGIALLLTFVLTAKVAGLHVLGFDEEGAMSTKMEALGDDGEFSVDDVKEAFATSTSMTYALDLSSWRLIVDFLAKLLVITAVFADLVLRATAAAWANDRALRARSEASDYDGAAAALLAATGTAGPS